MFKAISECLKAICCRQREEERRLLQREETDSTHTANSKSSMGSLNIDWTATQAMYEKELRYGYGEPKVPANTPRAASAPRVVNDERDEEEYEATVGLTQRK